MAPVVYFGQADGSVLMRHIQITDSKVVEEIVAKSLDTLDIHSVAEKKIRWYTIFGSGTSKVYSKDGKNTCFRLTRSCTGDSTTDYHQLWMSTLLVSSESGDTWIDCVYSHGTTNPAEVKNDVNLHKFEVIFRVFNKQASRNFQQTVTVLGPHIHFPGTDKFMLAVSEQIGSGLEVINSIRLVE
jgi:hypothetical protein